jgi:DNA-directed RNA polymerase specialized sigma subunit
MINPTTTFSLGPVEESAFQDLLENHLPLVRSIVERMKRKLPSNLETDQSMHETIPSDFCTLAPDFLDRKEVLSLLTQRMAELPDTPKKVLAMYYHENMRLAEIAACFRLSESRICQIHTHTIGLLRNYLDRYLA